MLSTYYFSEGVGFKKDLSRAEMHSIIKNGKGTLWVDLDDSSDLEDELLVEIFGFHELAIEDSFNDHCGPKMDDYGEYLFINMEPLAIQTDERGQNELVSREISIFFGSNYVVTLHKKSLASITSSRQLVEKKPSNYLGEGASSLLHTILDHVVDNYLPVVHQYNAKIEELENEIFNDPRDYLSTLMKVKRDIFKMRRVFGPERDLLHTLARCRTLVKKEDELYFRDVYDHLSHVHTMTDVLYENLSGILQIYFSYSSTKLNDVIKRLTIMATLTMPALLIFSLYGMNFEWMPFLHHPWAFWISQLITAGMAVIMLVWMKWKKWI